MPKYLAHVSYTGEGLKGLLKDGGTKRREVVVQLAKSLGGKLEAIYYALGEDDLFYIGVDAMPHQELERAGLWAAIATIMSEERRARLATGNSDRRSNNGASYMWSAAKREAHRRRSCAGQPNTSPVLASPDIGEARGDPLQPFSLPV